MLSRSRFSTLLVLLVAALAATPTIEAKDQKFTISKAPDRFNYGPHVAVNEATGDVLVVWNERLPGDPFADRVYSALCKLRPNGKYNVWAPRMVSPDFAAHEWCHVGFNPAAGTYLVVWTANKDQTGLQPADIEARVVDADGVPWATTIVPVGGDGFRNTVPYVHFLKDGSGEGGGEAYLLLWTRRSVPENKSGSFGLWSTILDPGGNRIAGMQQVYKSDNHAVEDLQMNSDGSFFVAGGPYEQNLIRLSKRGAFNKKNEMEGFTGIRLALLQPNQLIAAWQQIEEPGICMDRIYRGNLRPKGKAFDPLPGRKGTLSEIVKLADDPGCYQVVHSSSSFWGRYIDDKGNLTEPEKRLTRSIRRIREMRAVAVPGTNKVVVVWRRNLGETTSVINGYVFDAR